MNLGKESFSFTIDNDKRREVLQELETRIPKALEACGMQIENYAKLKAPVDTGLLRNSITHAVYGKSPAVSSYKSNATHATTPATVARGTAGLPVDPIRTGSYEGVMSTKTKSVYVGTNVEYAAYQELGSSRSSPQPYLKPALFDHKDEYMRMLQKFLQE